MNQFLDKADFSKWWKYVYFCSIITLIKATQKLSLRKWKENKHFYLSNKTKDAVTLFQLIIPLLFKSNFNVSLAE